MAYYGKVICPKCYCDFTGIDGTMCDSCSKIESKRKITERLEHLNALQRKPIEERIKLIEEWIYDNGRELIHHNHEEIRFK